MIQTVDATYDGAVFRPAVPLSLLPNTKVRITVEVVEKDEKQSVSFLDVAASLNLEGPADFSENLDKYLYGYRCDGGQ
jgi:hypothetical protein